MKSFSILSFFKTVCCVAVTEALVCLGFLTAGSRSYWFWFPGLSISILVVLAVGAVGYFLKLKCQRPHVSQKETKCSVAS